jgi:hypothetical protein
MPLGHRQVFFFFFAFKGIQVITNIVANGPREKTI